MPDQDRMTAAEFREEHGEEIGQIDADSAVAVDPGKTTGVAVLHKDGTLHTFTTDFWGIYHEADQAKRSAWSDGDYKWIVESPHLTEWGVHGPDNNRTIYNSGGVAREAELLVKGLRRRGFEVIEHDPHHSGGQWGSGKWNSKTAHQIVGEWGGPDNEHTRDALKMLFIYGLI